MGSIGRAQALRLGVLAWGFLVMLAAADPAWADLNSEPEIDYTDMSLEDLFDVDVVYGASKYQQSTSEAPASVTVITAEDIAVHGWRTLVDVLGNLRGFYTTNDLNYEYLGVRGFGRPGDYNSRVLVLIDGVRANENIYGSAAVGMDSPLDLDLIERIEVVRGPSSSLYGANAVFGVVNVVTKDGHRFDGVQVAGSVGTFGAYEGRLTAGSSADAAVNWLVSATAGELEGEDRYFPEFDDPATNNGVFEDGDRASWRRAFAKVSRGSWRVEGMYGRYEKNVPTAPWGTIFNDDRTWTMDESGQIKAGYQGDVGAETELTANFGYGYYEYHGSWVYDWADPGDPVWPVSTRDDARGRWLDGSLAATRPLGDRYRVGAGVDYRKSLRQDQAVWDEGEFWSYLDDSRRSENLGAYALMEFKASSQLLVNAAVRHDDYSTFGGTTHPRLALVAEVAPGSVVKALYGSAFREPNVYELYYEDGGVSTKSNPDLKPETMKTFEIILEQRVGAGLLATLAGFRYETKDLIEEITDPDDGLGIFQNLGVIESRGAEAELAGRLSGGVRGRASYSYQYTTRQETGALLTNSPRHMAKFNVAVPVWRPRSTVGCEVRYMSERRTWAGEATDGVALCNLTFVHRTLEGGVEVRGGVFNLFDTEYAHPSGREHDQDTLPQYGRSFRLTLMLSR